MSSFKTNTIYRGDCKHILRRFPKESIDMIYLDPPFFSNKTYEIVWGNGHELRAFEDRWKGGIMNYIDWLKERIEPCHGVLKKTGSLFLHCDWHAGHHIKVHVLDQIFDQDNFQNEIVWCYGGGGVSTQRFARKHDTIFFYSKEKNYKFNTQFAPYKPHSPYHSGGEAYREEGKVMEDYWLIPGLGSTSKEKLGYPTQKPESLLERIINSASDEGDIVLDPMCGGGTTIAVAHNLKRQFIGIDVSPTACNMMADRLRKLGAPINLYDMPTNIDELKALKPFDFQNWVVEQYSGRSERKTSDMGVDGYSFEGTPLQVKQSERVGRNVVDNFETAIRRKKKKEGIIVAFSFTPGAYEEVARVKVEGGLEIKLVTVKDLLDNFN